MNNSVKVLVCAVTAAISAFVSASYNISTNEERVVTISGTTEAFETIRTPFLDPDVMSLSFFDNNQKTFVLDGEEPSTYKGGTIVNYTQLRITNSGKLGSGRVLLRNHASLVVDADVAVTNAVSCYGDSVWMLGVGKSNLQLSALCPSEIYAYANIGRAGKSEATVTLSLNGEQNEALAGIKMRGELNLNLDGAELKASTGNNTTSYFIDTTPEYEKAITVSGRGFSFDAAEGVNIGLGLSLAKASYGVMETNTISAIAFPNGSFENGATGWKAYKVNSTGNIPGIIENGNTTWVGTTGNPVETPYGSKFYTIRSGQALSSTKSATITEPGQWFVSYVDSPRSGDSNGYYFPIDTIVTVSNITSTAFQTITHSADGVHGFNEVLVGPFTLEAGDYALIVENTLPKDDTQNYGAISYDNFAFKKVEIVPGGFPFVKRGAGHLQLSEFADDYGTVSVEGGNLTINSGTLKGTVVASQTGTELTVGAIPFQDNAKIEIADNATLRFCDVDELDGNLVADGSFEQNTAGDVINLDPRIGSSWTVEVVEENSNNNGANGAIVSGIQGYGGNVTPNNRPKAVAGAGAYSAAIRCQVRINQTIEIPEDGSYLLSFVAAKRYRSDYESATLRICPQIDGENLSSIVLSSENFEATELSVELTKGTHTLSFYVDSDWKGEGGPMAFVDLVRLTKIVSIPAIEDGSVNLKAGSTLKLDNIKPVYVKNFYVGGERIHGRRKHIEAAGVVVQGDGVIRVGIQTGLIVICR